jgi:hypothetical protein
MMGKALGRLGVIWLAACWTGGWTAAALAAPPPTNAEGRNTSPRPASAPASQPATVPATERGPWADAKVGTRVQFKLEGGMMQSQEVVKADANAVTVQTSLSVEGVKPTQSEMPRLHSPQESRANSEALGRKTGEENLRIGEQDFPCTVYQKEMPLGKRKITNKTWLCTEVPGWICRVDNDASGEMKTIILIVEFRK